jgi:hypothetical protein
MWGRPVTIGGELETDARYLGNLGLRDDVGDDEARIEQELEVEIFSAVTDQVFLFLKGEAVYRTAVYADGNPRTFEWTLRRGETWLYFGHVRGSPFSLQLGRQNLRDEREWWWERDLDAVRVHYDHPRFHAELALARKVTRVATDETVGSLVTDKTLRLLGQSTWEWAAHQRLDAFFLHHLHPARQDTRAIMVHIKFLAALVPSRPQRQRRGPCQPGASPLAHGPLSPAPTARANPSPLLAIGMLYARRGYARSRHAGRIAIGVFLEVAYNF